MDEALLAFIHLHVPPALMRFFAELRERVELDDEPPRGRAVRARQRERRSDDDDRASVLDDIKAAKSGSHAGNDEK